MSLVKNWKKIYLSDLDYVISELKLAMDRPAVLILSGEVGAGKTTFSKYFSKSISGKYEQFDVFSPTYSIINETKDIVHADLFRINKISEIDHLELPLYVDDKEYVLIEWGMPYLEHIERVLGDVFTYYQLEFEVSDDENDQHISSRNLKLSIIE